MRDGSVRCNSVFIRQSLQQQRACVIGRIQIHKRVIVFVCNKSLQVIQERSTSLQYIVKYAVRAS